MFILVCVALLLVTVIIMVLPLLRRATSREVAASELNTRLRAEQRQDLDERLALGVLEQAAYAQLCLELDKRLLEDVGQTEETQDNVQVSFRLPMVAIVVFIAVCSIALYSHLGQHTEQSLSDRFHSVFNVENPDVREALEIYQDISEYATPVTDENLEWLYMAAQGYMDISHFRKASELFDRMLGISGNEAHLLANAAQAHFLANDRVMNAKAKSYIDRALAINPLQANALSFAGMAAFEEERYSQAVSYWQRALDNVPVGQQQDSVLLGALAEAKRRMSSSSAEPTASVSSANEMSSNVARSINISLSVGGDIAVNANKTVFVLARAKSGPPMPLAVKRVQVKDLPVRVSLSAADAMSPAFSLASFDEVVVTARISLSGNAIRQSGDIAAQEVNVVLGDTAVNVELLLNQPIP